MIQDITEFPATPLVSIVVITYNSGKYVLETLESIKTQTYSNIGLIISDDFSTDGTVEICNNWIDKNRKRFSVVEIIGAMKNNGISANCNRGAKKAEGEWIKFIAGDDLLKPDSIQNFVDFSKAYPLADVIISKQESFEVSAGIKKLINIRPELDASNKKFYEPDISGEVQYNFLLYRKVLIAGPTYLIRKNLLSGLNFFDERYKLFEDYPLFLKITENGHKIYFMDKVTVEYRIHKNATSYSSNFGKIYPDYYNDRFAFLLDYNFKRLRFVYKIDLLIEFVVYKIILFTGNHGVLGNNMLKYQGYLFPSTYLRFFKLLK